MCDYNCDRVIVTIIICICDCDWISGKCVAVVTDFSEILIDYVQLGRLIRMPLSDW